MANNIIGVKNSNTIIPYTGTKTVGAWTSFSSNPTNLPVASSGTESYKYRRVGSDMEILISMQTAISASTSEATLTLPFNIDTTVALNAVKDDGAASYGSVVGTWTSSDSASGYGSADKVMVVKLNSSNILCFTYGSLAGATATIAQVAGPSYTKAVIIRASIPIADWANLDTTVDASIYIQPASASVDGIVNRSAQTFAGVKTANNGVCLGAAGNNLGLAALGLKCKIVSGTSAAAEGGVTTIAHNLTPGSIVAVTALMEFSSGQKVTPAYKGAAEYEYYLTQTTANVQIELSATNSGNLLSKLFYITIWYVE